MHVFSPLNVLWLPLVGGLIVLMYLLKLRRKDVVVSSTFLWRQVIRDVQANAPFQKLRRNLLLLLQLLLATLLVLALMRPFVRAWRVGGRNLVVIIDTSASMRASDIAPSRLDAAKSQAQELVRRMGPGDRMLLLSASARPHALTGFTDERVELRHAIDTLTPQDTPTNMRDALHLAADLVASQGRGEEGQIDLLSDGAFDGNGGANGQPGSVETKEWALAGLHLDQTRVVFHPIGKAHENVGITTLDFRRTLGDEKDEKKNENAVELLVVTHNYAGTVQTFTEEIAIEGNLFDAHEVTLAPHGENTEIFDVPEPDRPVTIRVQLDVRDDLAVDNEAFVVLKPRRLLKTLLTGKENLWLENALRVDPRIVLSKASRFTPGDERKYDVVIFNETAPAHLPEGHYLFLHCTSDQCPAQINGQTESSGFVDTERDHPVLRYVDFGRENLLTVYRAIPLGWGHEVAAGDFGSLIVVGEKNKTRAEFVSFSLETSVHLLLTVAFPIFVSDSVHWLGTGGDDSERGAWHTGETVSLPAPPETKHVLVTKPDGVKRAITADARGRAVFDDVDEVGLYRVEGENYKDMFAANLANAAESDIAPRSSLSLPNNAVPSSTHKILDHKILTVRELLPAVVFLALLLLLVEWFVFHRRVHLG